MDSNPIPAAVGAIRPSERAIVRGQRLVQVKFVALPLEIRDRPQFRIGDRRLFTRRRNWGPSLISVVSFIYRVFGRLVAARP